MSGQFPEEPGRRTLRQKRTQKATQREQPKSVKKVTGRVWKNRRRAVKKAGSTKRKQRGRRESLVPDVVMEAGPDASAALSLMGWRGPPELVHARLDPDNPDAQPVLAGYEQGGRDIIAAMRLAGEVKRLMGLNTTPQPSSGGDVDFQVIEDHPPYKRGQVINRYDMTRLLGQVRREEAAALAAQPTQTHMTQFFSPVGASAAGGGGLVPSAPTPPPHPAALTVLSDVADRAAAARCPPSAAAVACAPGDTANYYINQLLIAVRNIQDRDYSRGLVQLVPYYRHMLEVVSQTHPDWTRRATGSFCTQQAQGREIEDKYPEFQTLASKLGVSGGGVPEIFGHSFVVPTCRLRAPGGPIRGTQYFFCYICGDLITCSMNCDHIMPFLAVALLLLGSDVVNYAPTHKWCNTMKSDKIPVDVRGEGFVIEPRDSVKSAEEGQGSPRYDTPETAINAAIDHLANCGNMEAIVRREPVPDTPAAQVGHPTPEQRENCASQPALAATGFVDGRWPYEQRKAFLYWRLSWLGMKAQQADEAGLGVDSMAELFARTCRGARFQCSVAATRIHAATGQRRACHVGEPPSSAACPAVGPGGGGGGGGVGGGGGGGPAGDWRAAPAAHPSGGRQNRNKRGKKKSKKTRKKPLRRAM